jgi:lipopolysaccharide exporter
MMSGHSPSLGTRTLRGMFWAYGSFAGVRLASFLTTAVLARVLAPRDFGVIALAMTFMAFLDMLQGLGVGQALVVADADQVAEQADSAFALSAGMGLVLCVLAAALGPVAAASFHEHALVLILPALGLTFLLYGLGSTHYALAMREIDFRSRTVAEIADAVVRGGVGVTLAFAGAGVWSLVAGYVAGSLAMTVALWRLVAWRPRWSLRRAHVRRLLGFGGALTGVAIMGALLAQFDNAVVGRVLGATQLGFYSVANRLPYLFIISLASATGQVLYPAFASLSREELARAFVTALRYTAMVAFPLTAGLIVLARPVTLVVFGAHWSPAVAATRVLCLWALMSPVSMVCGNAFKARGRAGLLLALAVPQAIALIVGSLALVHHGIVAVAWVQATIAIVAQALTLWLACRMIAVPVPRALAAMAGPALACVGLAAVLLGITHVVSNPWLAVLAAGGAGVAVYLVLLRVLARDLLDRLATMARPRPRGAPQPGGLSAAHEASGLGSAPT